LTATTGHGMARGLVQLGEGLGQWKSDTCD